MRSLFIVVSKVFGLIQVYGGMAYLFTLPPMLHMLGQQSGSEDAHTIVYTSFYGEPITLTAISLVAMLLLTFGVAWLLIFRAAWLADKLSIPETDAISSFPVERILYTGIKLIGLFVIVQGIPHLTQAVCQMRYTMPFRAYMWSSVTAPLIRIAIGVILVIKTSAIIKLVMGKEKAVRESP
ncbi:MAG: hypothetical protein HYV35_02270 [Lentisphaerae bacterium]|nr:hypothetical protein [Lentisphaerota bacterium]